MEPRIVSFPQELITAPVPVTTNSYQAISHMELIRYLERKIKEKGFEVTSLRANSASGGNKMTGTMGINLANESFGMSIGFRNSYDKSMSLGVGVGATVFVCTNGMFHADVQRLRRHTTNMLDDLEEIIEEQLGYVQEQFIKFEDETEKLKRTVFTRKLVYQILGELFFAEKTFGSTQINIIRDEMDKSENFRMFGEGGEATGWNLYNNITESLKTMHPTKYFKAHADSYNKILKYAV